MKTFSLSVCIFSFIAGVAACAISSYHSNLLTFADDALLTAQIKSAFFLHPQTSSKDIHVETKERQVVLKGMVNSQQEVQVATFISSTIPGVLSVNSQQLKAKSRTQRSFT